MNDWRTLQVDLSAHQPNRLVKPTPTSSACGCPPHFVLRRDFPRALGSYCMTPALCTSIASRLFAYRWWFFGCAVLAVALFTIGLALAPPPRFATVGRSLLGPLVMGPWALLCTCVWFHPQRGNLQPPSKLVGRLPLVIQAGVRWYAAILLFLFFVAGVVVWPFLSVVWL